MTKLILLFLLVGSTCFAQKNKGKQKEELKPIELTSPQKDSIVKKIYNRIYDACGDFNERPQIRLSNSSFFVASYTPSQNSSIINFENDAFNVCQSLGDRRDDAIAFLISHEIGHHLTFDFWNGNYQDFEIKIKDSLIEKYGLDENKKVKQKNVIATLQEIKADEKGSILRYMAGYSSENITESLFSAIYKKYIYLKDTMYCYPPLQDRINISKIGDARAKSFIDIFEMASFSVLLEDYDFAIKQYKTLLYEYDFHSREIYNNLGVIYYLKAMQLADENDVKFIFPVEIDLESRIKTNRSRGFEPNYFTFLSQADEYFKKATSLDKEYSTGYLNRASILTILGEDYDLAKSECKKAIKYAKNDLNLQNAQLVLAFIELKSEDGNKDEAMLSIKNLIAKGNELAILNKTLIDGKEWADLVSTKPLNPDMAGEQSYGFSTLETKESIQNISGVNDILNAEFDAADTLYYGNPRQILETFYLSNSKVIKVDEKYLFISTENNYIGSSSLGIKLNSTEKELKEKYGLPTIIIPAAQGWIYHYPNSSMMVILSSDKIVTKWMIYHEMY